MSGPKRKDLALVDPVIPTLTDKAVTLQNNKVKTTLYSNIYNLFKQGYDTLYATTAQLANYVTLNDLEDILDNEGGFTENNYSDGDKAKVDNLPSNTLLELDNKVDKILGKGLSTEDYTTTEKNKVANLPNNTINELLNKVNVESGKQLSQENFTSTEKSKLASLSLTYVGTYLNLQALQQQYPTGEAGYEAIIDGGANADPQKAFWDVSDNKWVIQTGGGASSFSEIAGSPSDNVALQDALDGKSNIIHIHAISDVSNLQTNLDNKANVNHTHDISQVTGLQTALDGKAASLHTHSIEQINGLNSTLNEKATFVKVSSFEGLPALGNTGTLYITTNNNSMYHWDGAAYQLVVGTVIRMFAISEYQ